MKKNRMLAVLLAFWMLVTFSACMIELPGFGKDKDKEKDKGETSSSEQEKVDPNWPVQIGDIKLEGPPTIISLSPALTEIICELGGEDQLAGVSDFCSYPEMVKSLPKCGTAQLLNRDEIKTLSPSPRLVVSSSKLSQEDLVWLQQQGMDAMVLSRADSMDGIEELYVSAGTMLGGKLDGEQNGQNTFSRLDARYNKLVLLAATVPEPLNGIYLRAAPLMMATGDTLEGKLLTQIGIKNDAQDYSGWEFPADKAAGLYPKIIFYDSSIDPAYFKGTQIYNTTSAFQQNLMFPVDGTAFERQSGRMIDELEKMFKAAYPDIKIEEQVSAEEPKDSTPVTQQPASSDGEEMLNISDETKIKEK